MTHVLVFSRSVVPSTRGYACFNAALPVFRHRALALTLFCSRPQGAPGNRKKKPVISWYLISSRKTPTHKAVIFYLKNGPDER